MMADRRNSRYAMRNASEQSATWRERVTP
jgi:hypothetical protein